MADFQLLVAIDPRAADVELRLQTPELPRKIAKIPTLPANVSAGEKTNDILEHRHVSQYDDILSKSGAA